MAYWTEVRNSRCLECLQSYPEVDIEYNPGEKSGAIFTNFEVCNSCESKFCTECYGQHVH